MESDSNECRSAAYREGRCLGLYEIYELRKPAAGHPQYAEAWASGRSAITRERVMALRANLAEGLGSVRALHIGAD